MKIQFDETNLLAGVIGEADAATHSEVEAHRPRAMDALAAVRRQSEAGVFGFAHLPFAADTARGIAAYARQVRGTYECVCLVGIGGSALGAWALDCGLRGPHPVQGPWSAAHPRLVVLDNVDPLFIAAALDSMNPRRTLVLAIAKSGATAETAATLAIVREWLALAMGRKTATRIAVVTSKGHGDLAALAQRENYRTFHLPENVGGRFSVLSAVGLLPAALVGIDIARLLRGAREMTHLCWQADLQRNVALRAALFHHLLLTAKRKTIQVAFPYCNRLWGLAFWFRQLWAESLGKARTRRGETVHAGQTPIAALGTTDQHSQVQLYIEGPNDKVFTFWSVEKMPAAPRVPRRRLELPAFDYLAGHSLAELIDAERRSTAAALADARRPSGVFTLEKLDAEHLGAFLQLLEFETAFMGELLDINAFDQEGVELGKKFTFGLMGRTGFESFAADFKRYEQKRAAARRV